MSGNKRRRHSSGGGCGGLFYMFLAAGICFMLLSGFEKIVGLFPSSSPEPYKSLTPEKGYLGDCHHWTKAAGNVGENTCIWGIALNAVQGSWVWLHFSYRSEPYPDFAVDLEDNFRGDFKLTVENVGRKYSGHCVEVYGLVKNEPNTYNGRTVNQPVIHVTQQEQLIICDNLLK